MTGIPQGAVTRPAMVTARSAGKLKPPLASAGGGFLRLCSDAGFPVESHRAILSASTTPSGMLGADRGKKRLKSP